MAFCTKCGADIPDGIKFCTSCGNTISEASGMPSVVQSQPERTASNSGASGTPPSADSRCAVMSTGAYIGTMLLFCIPVVGWLVCVVMAFAAKNQNRRNFARAMLVFLLIGIVLSVILYFILSWVSEAVMLYINEATGNMFDEFDGLNDIFDMINGAGLTGN